MKFKSTIVNIPGLGNSDENHWQSIWEKEFPNNFIRINQKDWNKPNCDDWVATIEKELIAYDYSNIILVGHSVGSIAIIKWLQSHNHKIKGALLVAPSDVERGDYPQYIKGFSPIPSKALPFKSIVVASTNDHVVSLNRAAFMAKQWNSDFHILKNADHIEPKSGFGKWDSGLQLLKTLDV